MSAGRSTTLSGVSRADYAALCEYLQAHHDFAIGAGSGRVALRGPHLRGWLSHDVDASTLQVEIDEHPQLVTPGYLIGQLYDRLADLATAPASTVTASKP